MTGFRPPPQRHWRSYGEDPLPTPAEALNEMFGAFPSWFLRIECGLCGKVVMINESHAATKLRRRPLSEILARMRHDNSGGLPGKAELLSGIEGASSRPVRKIVLMAAHDGLPPAALPAPAGLSGSAASPRVDIAACQSSTGWGTAGPADRPASAS